MENFKKVILSKNELFEFYSKGMLINIEVDRKRDLIRLRTTVFSETGFIPFSIRECVSNVTESCLNKKYPALLVIKEEHCKVDLIQEFEGGVEVPLIKLIKLFTFVARSWAPLLKRIAENDLLMSN